MKAGICHGAFLIALVLLCFAGPASAACPSPLQNNTTANANDVMAWLDCKAPLDVPSFSGSVSIAPVAYFNPSSLKLERGTMGSLASTQAGIVYQHNGGIAGNNEALVFDTGTTGNDYRFRSGGTDRLIINGTSGNVGLGAAPTLGHLQIDGSGNQVLSINSSNDDSTIRLYRAGTMKWRIYNNSGGASDNLVILDADQDNGVTLAQNSNSWASASDARLKRNVRTLPVLSRLSHFRAVTFDWRSDGRHDIGVIAQELDAAFPELVRRGNSGPLKNYRLDQAGTWAVDYSKLGAVALAGVKELDDQVTELRALVRAQAAELSILRSDIAAMKRNRLALLQREG